MSKSNPFRLKPGVYVKAAKRLKLIDRQYFSCHAVTAAACAEPNWNPLNPYTVAYQDTFAMDEATKREGWSLVRRDVSHRSPNYRRTLPRLNEIRMLALLFMAEFARTEKL